jgi:hypothetical protein
LGGARGRWHRLPRAMTGCEVGPNSCFAGAKRRSNVLELPSELRTLPSLLSATCFPVKAIRNINSSQRAILSCARGRWGCSPPRRLHGSPVVITAFSEGNVVAQEANWACRRDDRSEAPQLPPQVRGLSHFGGNATRALDGTSLRTRDRSSRRSGRFPTCARVRRVSVAVFEIGTIISYRGRLHVVVGITPMGVTPPLLELEDTESGRIRRVRGDDPSSSSNQRNAFQPTTNDCREGAAAISGRLS